jgi:predicted nuclease with TOPRIM domain
MVDEYIAIRKKKMVELERESVPLLNEKKRYQIKIDDINAKLSALYTKHAKLETEIMQYEDTKAKRR